MNEVIKILKQFRDRQGNSKDDLKAFDVAINAVESKYLNEHDIDVICYHIKEKANKKEKYNKMGVCDMEVVGFVHGLRWTISYLKSLKG